MNAIEKLEQAIRKAEETDKAETVQVDLETAKAILAQHPQAAANQDSAKSKSSLLGLH